MKKRYVFAGALVANLILLVILVICYAHVVPVPDEEKIEIVKRYRKINDGLELELYNNLANLIKLELASAPNSEVRTQYLNSLKGLDAAIYNRELETRPWMNVSERIALVFLVELAFAFVGFVSLACYAAFKSGDSPMIL